MLNADCYALHFDLEQEQYRNPLHHVLEAFGTAIVIDSADKLRVERNSSSRDYRRGELQVDSVEMYYKGAFMSSKTESVSLGQGVLHLYKGNLDNITTAGSGSLSLAQECAIDVLAILAVPSYMTSADLLGFFGESLQQISHIRILRTDDLRHFIVLLKFRAVSEAQSFHRKFNGAVFNPMEPETVHCVPIGTISFAGQERAASDFPVLTAQSQAENRPLNRKSHKAMPPIMSLTELPTCVVCLERMDATTTGLLTIACEHTFHCNCLSKWVDTQATCPICRFSVARDVLKDSHKHCFSPQCSSDKNLWMCLICGAINCGRYESQHAIGHYNASNHAFAMDLDSGRIWDYSSDSYVHRLLEEKIGASSMMPKSGSASKSDASGGAEFEELLAAQLESQRLYYEDQVATAVKKASKATREAQMAEQQIKELKEGLWEREGVLQGQQEEIRIIKEAQTRLEGKSKIIADVARQTKLKFTEEKSITESLMRKIAHMEDALSQSQTQKDAVEREVAELKEQVRDLMGHFASMQQLNSIDPRELEGAQIQVVSKTNGAQGKKKRTAKAKTTNG